MVRRILPGFGLASGFIALLGPALGGEVSGPGSLADAIRVSTPSLVRVISEGKVTTTTWKATPQPKRWMGTVAPVTKRGDGSGFVWDEDGHVVTAEHVVSGSDRIRVFVAGERGEKEHEAKLLGADGRSGVALLKVDDLKAPPLRQAEAVLPGEWIVAAGFPYSSSSPFFSAGIVSRIDAELDAARAGDFIQTDAQMHPGSGGGPLLNVRGEAVGMSYATQGTRIGIGYAVPMGTLRRVVEALKTGEPIRRAHVGVHVDTQAGRVVLQQVIDGGPGEKAGLKPGDEIVAVDGAEVDTSRDFIRELGKRHPGDRVEITLMRGNKKMAVPVELGEWPEGLTPPPSRIRTLPGPTVEIRPVEPLLDKYQKALDDYMRALGAVEGKLRLPPVVMPEWPDADRRIREYEARIEARIREVMGKLESTVDEIKGRLDSIETGKAPPAEVEISGTLEAPEIRFRGETYRDLDDFSEAFEKDPTRAVAIRVKPETPYDVVRAVVDRMHKAGVRDLKITLE